MCSLKNFQFVKLSSPQQIFFFFFAVKFSESAYYKLDFHFLKEYELVIIREGVEKEIAFPLDMYAQPCFKIDVQQSKSFRIRDQSGAL